MEIVCQSCESKFRIPDEKIPEGKIATFPCPKCKERIKVKRPEPEPEATVDFDAMADPFGFDELDEADDLDADRPFDFVEDEGKTAMVCERDPEVLDHVKTVLDVLEYHIIEPENSRDALKKLRYQSFDVIVVNEHFDTTNPDANGILIYLERLDINIRRNMFVSMLSRRFRTMDHMAAFQKSVNLILNVSNIHDFDKILRRGLADFDLFYRVFREFDTKM